MTDVSCSCRWSHAGAWTETSLRSTPMRSCWAAYRVFREKPEGQTYLRSRGLVDPEMLQAFEVGYVDGSLSRTFDAGGEVARALAQTGVLTAKGREHFLGCVVFPLRLPDEGIVGLYGRHITRDQHLYLPGPRRRVFH